MTMIAGRQSALRRAVSVDTVRRRHSRSLAAWQHPARRPKLVLVTFAVIGCWACIARPHWLALLELFCLTLLSLTAGRVCVWGVQCVHVCFMGTCLLVVLRWNLTLVMNMTLTLLKFEANFFVARTFLDIVCLYYKLAMKYIGICCEFKLRYSFVTIHGLHTLPIGDNRLFFVLYWFVLSLPVTYSLFAAKRFPRILDGNTNALCHIYTFVDKWFSAWMRVQ